MLTGTNRQIKTKDLKLPMFKMKFNETYRQVRKIFRLESAQTNFNNLILCTTKSCLPLPHPWVLAPLIVKKSSPQVTFFNFSSLSESQEGHHSIDSLFTPRFYGLWLYGSFILSFFVIWFKCNRVRYHKEPLG